jgi:UDP-N-acetylglucosamine 2-epimerase (non-hydrolysing)
MSQLRPIVGGDPMTFLLVVGARPNFMKVAPVYRALERLAPDLQLVLVHTGQHYDDRMSQVFFQQLAMPEPDIFLGVGSGSHAEQTGRAMIGIETIIIDTAADLVVVAGDVNSTLAGALAAVKLHVPVAHIEAGLRSFDDRMPEEHNRRLTDAISTILLTHSPEALDNLRREGIDPSRVHLVGNTMIDSLLDQLPKALAGAPWHGYDVAEGEYALVTLHRPALVDDEALLRSTMDALDRLSMDVPVIFPVHPRTRGRIDQLAIRTGPRLRLAEPIGYLDFLGLQARARFVLTDSGGVQEETSALGVPCFTLRDSTERPITVTAGTNMLLGALPQRISEIPELLSRLEPTQDKPPIPLWDGRAGERTATVLIEHTARQAAPT